MRSARRISTAIALLWFCASVVLASDNNRIVEGQVVRAIDQIEGWLVDGDWERVVAEADQLLLKMILNDLHGRDSRRLYGRTFSARAAAVEMLGSHREALWDWDCALLLSEDSVDFVTLRMVRVAEELAAETSRRASQPIETGDLVRKRREAFVGAERLPTPAAPALSGRFEFPRAGTVNLKARIDEHGVLAHPEGVKEEDLDSNTSLLARTLIEMREWRFTPATFDGTPVPIYWNGVMRYQKQ